MFDVEIVHVVEDGLDLVCRRRSGILIGGTHWSGLSNCDIRHDFVSMQEYIRFEWDIEGWDFVVEEVGESRSEVRQMKFQEIVSRNGFLLRKASADNGRNRGLNGRYRRRRLSGARFLGYGSNVNSTKVQIYCSSRLRRGRSHCTAEILKAV